MAGASAHARQPSGADGPSDDARNARLLAHLRTGVARLRKAPDEPAHELVIIEANAALEALVGGAPLVGRRLADVLAQPSPDDDRRHAAYAQVLRTGEPLRVEVHLPQLDRAAAITAYRSGPDELTVLVDDTTPRLRAEAAARRADELRAAAFHASAAAIAITRDRDGQVVDCNAQFAALLGRPHAAVLGRTAAELALAPGAAGATAAPREAVVTTADGAPRSVLTSTSPIVVDGEGACTLTTYVDITARTRAERRLATHHACLRALAVPGALDHAIAGMLAALGDGDGWAAAAVAVLDRVVRPIPVLGVWAATPELVGPIVAGAGWLTARAVAMCAPITIARATADPADAAALDELGTDAAIAVPIHAGGAPIGALVVLAAAGAAPDRPALDTLASLAPELGVRIARARSEQALRASEDSLRAVIDALHEGVVTADEHGRLVHWNPAALRMHDLAPDDDGLDSALAFAGRWELTTLDGDPVPPSTWPLWRILAGEVIRDCELIVRRRDRPWQRVFSFGGSLITVASGGRRAVLTIVDITERVRAAAALRQLNAELEQRVLARTAELAASNRELEAFCYTVSHDLRAPLRAINGFAEILLDDYAAALGDEPTQLLANIRDGGKRLGTLIDDLLAFARLGRAALHPRPVDVEEMVGELAAELTRAAGGRVRVQVGALARCVADPALLRLVWINLLDNAIKYSRDRSPAVIQVSCDATESIIAYRVRDNGVGFDAQYAHRLFGVFQRLHTSAEFPGTGVGLANVRRIIERHGGRVSATGVPDQGATFSFTLPAAAEPADRRG